MAITVRELVTKLTIGGNAGEKLAKFGLAVDGVKAGLQILVGTIKVLSRVSIGLATDVSKVGDSIDKTSKSVGLSTKEFQRLTFAAERTGTPIGNLVKGLQNVQRNIRDAALAARGGKQTGFSSALEEVGLRLEDLQGLNSEETFGLIGEALSQVEDAGRRVALSQKLVGEEAGPKMASFLAEGQSGIKALGDEAEKFGLIMDEDAIKASVAFQDSLTDLMAVLEGVKRAVGVSLIPQLRKGVDTFKDWLLVNREIIKQRMDSIVKVLANAFSFLLKNSGKIFDLFESGVVILEKLIRFLLEATDAVGGLENLIKLAAVAWGTYAVAQALALGPIGIMAAALIGLATAFFKVETAADRARFAQEKFGKSADENVPLDRKQAERDAASAARRLRGGGDISSELTERLVAGSASQALLTIKLTRKLLRPLSVQGKSGTGVTTSSQLAALRALRAVERDLADRRASEKRARDRSSRTLESRGDVLDPTRGLDFGTPKPGGGGGGGRVGGRTGATGTGGGANDSVDDLVAQAIKAGTSPEVAALLTSTQPPIIIPITNNSFTISVEAPVTVTGVPGEQGEEFSERVTEIFRTEHILVIKDAFEQLRPRLVR